MEVIDGIGDEHDAGPDARLLLVVRPGQIEYELGAFGGHCHLHVALVPVVPRHLELQDLGVKLDGLGQIADRHPHLADLQKLPAFRFRGLDRPWGCRGAWERISLRTYIYGGGASIIDRR